METMNRREFLRAGVGLAAVAGGLGMICGCATTETPKVETLVHPPLPYNKIQPSQEGCFVGFYKEPPRLKDSRFVPLQSPEIEAAQRAKTFDEYMEMLKKGMSSTKRYQIENEIAYVEKGLTTRPSVFVLAGVKFYSEFPVTPAIEVAKRGITPYILANPGPSVLPIPIPGFGPKEIAQGQNDGYIKKFAQGAAEFGKKYGGFFINTFEEMNGNWFSWGMDSNSIPAWRHIWQIFEDQGANQYATWVWVTYCLEGLEPFVADDAEAYYPGDKYVDWIGLNAFSVAGSKYKDRSLYNLIHRTSRKMLKTHPTKRIMLSAFARTNEYYQSRWLINAYNSIKKSFPAIKTAIYYDNTSRFTGDHTLNPKSLQTLKEIFRDPYWIMGK